MNILPNQASIETGSFERCTALCDRIGITAGTAACVHTRNGSQTDCKIGNQIHNLNVQAACFVCRPVADQSS